MPSYSVYYSKGFFGILHSKNFKANCSLNASETETLCCSGHCDRPQVWNSPRLRSVNSTGVSGPQGPSVSALLTERICLLIRLIAQFPPLNKWILKSLAWFFFVLRVSIILLLPLLSSQFIIKSFKLTLGAWHVSSSNSCWPRRRCR